MITSGRHGCFATAEKLGSRNSHDRSKRITCPRFHAGQKHTNRDDDETPKGTSLHQIQTEIVLCLHTGAMKSRILDLGPIGKRAPQLNMGTEREKLFKRAVAGTRFHSALKPRIIAVCRKGVKEFRFLQKFPGRRRHFHLVEWFTAKDFPETIAALNRHEFGQKTSLTVANDNHPLQRGALSLRINLIDDIFLSAAKQHRGIENRLPSIVLKEPELKSTSHHGIVHQFVIHLSPTRRTRCRAMHQYHGYPSLPVWVHHNEAITQYLSRLDEAKTRDLKVPDRRPFQSVRKRRRRLQLQGHIAVADSHVVA